MRTSFAALIAAGCLALAAGCAGAPEPDSNAINITVLPDGSFAALDARGRPSTDPMSRLLVEMMNQQQAEKAGQGGDALAEDEIWMKDAGGNLEHILSGAQCPLQWGAFSFDRSMINRPDGEDVGCNYEHPGGGYMTWYVYTSPDTLQGDLDGAVDAMKQRTPVSKEADYTYIPQGDVYKARTLTYTGADGVAMRTSVLLSEAGKWRLKMRVTTRAADAVSVEQAAGIALIGQWDRLRAGVKTPPPKPAASPA